MNKPLAKVSDGPVECRGRRQDFLVDPTEAFSQFWVKDVSRPSLMQKSSCRGSKQGDPGWSPLSLVVFGRSDTFRLANSCTPRSGGPEKQRTRLISVQPELESQSKVLDLGTVVFQWQLCKMQVGNEEFKICAPPWFY